MWNQALRKGTYIYFLTMLSSTSSWDILMTLQYANSSSTLYVSPMRIILIWCSFLSICCICFLEIRRIQRAYCMFHSFYNINTRTSLINPNNSMHQRTYRFLIMLGTFTLFRLLRLTFFDAWNFFEGELGIFISRRRAKI